MRDSVAIVVALALLVVAGELRADEPRPVRILLLEVPDSGCRLHEMSMAVQGLGVGLDTALAEGSEALWLEAARHSLEQGTCDAVVCVTGDEELAEVRVLTGESAVPRVLKADGAGCGGAATMGVLYAKRLLSGDEVPERPVPSLRLKPDTIVAPGTSKTAANHDSPPVPPQLTLDLLSFLEANTRDESPELLGGDVRLAVRLKGRFHLDIGMAAAPFVGLQGAYQDLQGVGLTVATRGGYVWAWSQVELVALASLGLSDYILRKAGEADWKQSLLPRCELGLQVRMAHGPRLFAEVTGLWEPRTVDVISQELGTTWRLGGPGLGVRLGGSLSLLAPSAPGLPEENSEGPGSATP